MNSKHSPFTLTESVSDVFNKTKAPVKGVLKTRQWKGAGTSSMSLYICCFYLLSILIATYFYDKK